jgi:hypothetical protein
MGRAIGERHRAAIAAGIGERVVGGVTVDLQDAGEARELLDRMLGAPAQRVEIGNRGRVGPFPGSVIAGDRPEVAGLGLPPTGIEHRSLGLVHEQPGRALEKPEQALSMRPVTAAAMRG